MKIVILVSILIFTNNCGKFSKQNSDEKIAATFNLPNTTMIDSATNISDLINSARNSRINVNFDELIIAEGGKLNLEGKSANLKIKKLVSDKGEITGASNIAGSGAGTVNITANRAEGTIRINLNGIDGLDGLPGAEGKYKDDSPSGTSKLNGNHGSEVYDSFGRFACVTQPEDGTTPPSFDGESGGDGGNGGDSGEGTFITHSKSNFEVIIENNPGIGGRGGIGGISIAARPGIGGLILREPTKIGILNEIKNGAELGRCKAAKNGQAGVKGVDGENGLDGKNGEKKYFCTIINGEKNCF